MTDAVDAVTVVVAALNPGSYLRHALNSVVAQSHGRWSAIVVDDGGSEDLSYVETLDPRILLLRQRHAGLSAARNAGIRATTAPLITFLDADDLWLPSKLEKQVAAMAASDAVLCYTDFEVIDGSGGRTGPGYSGPRSYVELLEGCGVCVSTVMIRRDALDRSGLFDLRYRQVQDWDLWLRLARIGSLAQCDETLAQYRIHSVNMSRDYARLLDEGTAVLRNQMVEATPEIRASALRGIKNLRRLAGAQAFDAFRERRRPVDLARALRLAPHLTIGQMRRFIASRLR